MPGDFRGESIHKVDPKGRVSIPAPFRHELMRADPNCPEGGNPSFVIVYGFDDQPMLECYTMEGAARIAAAIRRMPRSNPNRKRIQRKYQTKSVTLQVDENGRLVLPAKLREKIGIDGNAVFAGMGDTFEIWSTADYEMDDGDMATEFNESGDALNESMDADLDRYTDDVVF